MAIALDAATRSNVGSGTTLSFSKTCTGSNLILFFNIVIGSTSDLVTAVTYNGVSAFGNLVQKQNVSGFTYLFYLIAPATGSNTVVVTTSGSTAITCTAISYTGVDQTTAIGESILVPATVQNPTTTLTVTHANSWMITVAASTSGVLTAGTGATIRDTSTSENTFDSNGALAIGNQSMTINNSGGVTGIIMASFFPVGSLSIALSTGVFVLTGRNITLATFWNITMSVGTFILTGVSTTLSAAANLWTNTAKNITSWTNSSK